MYFLFIGLLIFFGVHLIPSFANIRLKIISTMGEGAYKGLYSVLSLIGITLIVYSKSTAVFQPIWEPPFWSKYIVIFVMVISFYFFAAAEIKSNVKRFFRHPMLLGVMHRILCNIFSLSPSNFDWH